MKDQTVKKDTRPVLLDILFVGAILLFIAFSFIAFIRSNNQRILEQNNSFIESVTEQTGNRINDLISMAQSSVEIMGSLYGTTMPEPVVDSEMLQDMIDRSTFDYVEFISRDGIDLTADGRTADLSDREYFLDGMAGNSGKCVIYNSRITNETLLIFYSPFYYENEIIGVLSGILRGDTVYDILTSSYFGVQASSYLLERNGNVIISAGDDSDPENLLKSLTSRNQLSDADQHKLVLALVQGTSTSFNYEGSVGAGSAYITALKDGEWMLVQYFPSSLTKDMSRQANSAGIWLEIRLIIAFLCYVLYLVLKNRYQKKQLVSENQEISRIVDAATLLFTRFALVDLEKDTYEYLESKGTSAPETGKYSDLIRYLDAHYLSDGPDGEKMSVLISGDYVQKHLTEDVPYLQWEYEIDMEGHRWENISVLCLKRKNGVPVRLLYAIQDVTALKEQEQQIRTALKNASAAAEAANQAKSDFLARMSHDIRTPMNAIIGMTAVALMHLDDRDRLNDCLDKITISSRHLLALINDVLDMSKIESGKVTLSEEPFEMQELIESIRTIIQSQTDSRNQTLNIQVSDIIHSRLSGDALRLRQVLVNILGNAVKFTPKGGTITFSVRECGICASGMTSYEFVCQDTGIGMDAEFLKTIFDPFTRADSSASREVEGTGLGMAITRNIVRMMNGDIQVESTVGEGSRFTVNVPLRIAENGTESGENVAAQAAAGSEAFVGGTETGAVTGGAGAEKFAAGTGAGEETGSTDAEKFAAGTETGSTGAKRQRADIAALKQADFSGNRVLLVEDNELNREIANELLSVIGVAVEQAENGRIAVEMVEHSPLNYYDLIFMDIQMPVMDGYEAVRAIRSLDRKDAADIPIVAMSANAFADDIRNAHEAGMNDHVAKPVEISKLLETLERWL